MRLLPTQQVQLREILRDLFPQSDEVRIQTAVDQIGEVLTPSGLGLAPAMSVFDSIVTELAEREGNITHQELAFKRTLPHRMLIQCVLRWFLTSSMKVIVATPTRELMDEVWPGDIAPDSYGCRHHVQLVVSVPSGRNNLPLGGLDRLYACDTAIVICKKGEETLFDHVNLVVHGFDRMTKVQHVHLTLG